MMFKVVPILRSNISNHIKRVCKRDFGLSTKLLKDDPEDIGPIKFSASPASKYKARSTRTGYYEPRLWYEPYVIMTSISVFLVYFMFLREENDIDEDLGRNLYSRIEGLEELQLRQSLEYNLAHGKESAAIVKRLKEIEEEKKSALEEEEVP
ncbi:unnamed protein product [Psylliodes chrysocephalus]|uniref:Uncharacterized protein n=1 Tax=Psylliodes chrysocephalus TaxID=3402493 RepID=A0A9P0CAL1_9CUCU|nr:unnamed protein product [Psylliodes chrysocephala]